MKAFVQQHLVQVQPQRQRGLRKARQARQEKARSQEDRGLSLPGLSFFGGASYSLAGIGYLECIETLIWTLA